MARNLSRRGRGAALAVALAAAGTLAVGCGVGDKTKDKMQAAADSMVSQRDSTIAHTDSAGIVHDSAQPPGARKALMAPDTTKLGARKTESTLTVMRKKTGAKP